MEGVGARLGRSSTRYGPTPVFTGPVRKWKKKWVPVPPPNSNQHNHTASNESNGSSHLLLFKWTSIAPNQTKDSGNNDINGTNNGNAGSNEDDGVAAEEPPKRKFKYIPIVVLEEQNDEFSEEMEDETKHIDNNTNNVEATLNGYDEKPDINDVLMDENQAMKKNIVERQDLNVSTLDLSLGLNARDGENDSDSKAD